MPQTTGLEALLRRQSRALGRHLRPAQIFRRVIRREVAGRPPPPWECVRRLAPPGRYRDDVRVNGAWRFSESFDGTRAWYLTPDETRPREGTGRALAAQRWAGILLDHLRPLGALRRLGCTLADGGVARNVRGDALPTVRIALGDAFAETVFLDEAGRIAAHHMDLPEAGEDEQELELCVDDWGEHGGLVHPVRSTILDRATGAAVAVLTVAEAGFLPASDGVFDLTAD